MHTNSSFLEKEERQQMKAIDTITWYGIIISISYAVLYFFMAMSGLTIFNVVMSIVYSGIYIINKKKLRNKQRQG